MSSSSSRRASKEDEAVELAAPVEIAVAPAAEPARMRRSESNVSSETSNKPTSKSDLMEAAREAFREGDVNASKVVHDQKLRTKAPEGHNKGTGDVIKSVVLGGLDGIITTFAIVTGVIGADLSTEVVLILGFANLIADGISMGDALSESGENDYINSEKRRELWEFENYPAGEIEEMVEIYTSKGFSEQNARTILEIMATNPDFFVDHMLVQELDLMPPDPDVHPIKNGLVTFFSFLVFGFVPLLAFLIFHGSTFEGYDPRFLVSIILTLLTMAALGAVKGHISNTNRLVSAFQTVLIGAAAAGASYGIGAGLKSGFGEGVEGV